MDKTNPIMYKFLPSRGMIINQVRTMAESVHITIGVRSSFKMFKSFDMSLVNRVAAVSSKRRMVIFFSGATFVLAQIK